MAVPAIEVTSLQQAMESVHAVPRGEGRSVVVGKVRVRHASALAELLRFQPAGRGRRVENSRRLKKLAVADSLLTVVGTAVLADLYMRPTHKPALKLLRRYARRIKSCAVVVGPDFNQGARVIYDELLELAKDGLRRPHLRSTVRIARRHVRLLDNILELRQRISAFRSRDYRLVRQD